MTDTKTDPASWLSALEASLNARDISAAAELFAPEECFWRDFVAFTWNIATMDGWPAIAAMLAEQLAAALPVRFTIDEQVSDAEAWIGFETRTARGKGHVRLRGGKAWTLLTSMTELKGFEEPGGRRRSEGIRHVAERGRTSWADQRAHTAATLGITEQPFCLIVGGGQGGLALAARMKRLAVPTLIVDALARPGDSWRSRYNSLYLHDPVWIDHLPYLPFPDHWPVYTHKDKMGDWLEAYAKIMELDIWSSTACRGARYDGTRGEWEVEVDRSGERMTLRPRQLVLATGLSGMKQVPVIAGAERFEGIAYHSSEHRGADGMAGKRAIVIGANNSAHDICVDLWAAHAEVTMIQRSPTTVIKVTAMRRVADREPFSENAVEAGITTERADLTLGSLPFRLKEPIDRANVARFREEDADFYARLAASGFRFDFGEDDTGIQGKYMRRASGYYIDVGGSDLIADGEIKVAQGSVVEIRPRSVVLDDGRELPADLIVYATGYGNMNEWAAQLISPAVADKVGPCWGLGSGTAYDPGPWQGELRNMWKPTAQAGLWFHGGNLAQSRFHSLHLALQIKARMEGVAGPVHQPAAFERVVS